VGVARAGAEPPRARFSAATGHGAPVEGPRRAVAKNAFRFALWASEGSGFGSGRLRLEGTSISPSVRTFARRSVRRSWPGSCRRRFSKRRSAWPAATRGVRRRFVRASAQPCACSFKRRDRRARLRLSLAARRPPRPTATRRKSTAGGDTARSWVCSGFASICRNRRVASGFE